MLELALRLSLLLEMAFYATLAMHYGDTSLAAAIALALLAMLALRAAAIAVTYAYAWAYRGPSPRLPLRQTLLMVLGEYAAMLFTFMVLSPFERLWMGDDRLPPRAGNARLNERGAGAAGEALGRRPPILLIHGYGCSRAAWWWLRSRLEVAGWSVATISLEPIYTSIDNYLEPLDRRIDDVLAATGAERVVLVGHSMGGLVARAYLQRYGAARVARLLTLGTPHQGSELARLGIGENGRQMRPQNAWLQALGKPSPALDALVIYSPQDNFVMPASLLELPGARKQEIVGLGLLAMLYSPRVVLALLAALDEPRAERGEGGEVGESETEPQPGRADQVKAGSGDANITNGTA